MVRGVVPRGPEIPTRLSSLDLGMRASLTAPASASAHHLKLGPPIEFYTLVGERYRMRLEFNDCAVREVDCTFLLHGPLGEPIQDPEFGSRVFQPGSRRRRAAHDRLGPNGLDPAPELLHGDYEAAVPPSSEQRPAALEPIADAQHAGLPLAHELCHHIGPDCLSVRAQ